MYSITMNRCVVVSEEQNMDTIKGLWMNVRMSRSTNNWTLRSFVIFCRLMTFIAKHWPVWCATAPALQSWTRRQGKCEQPLWLNISIYIGKIKKKKNYGNITSWFQSLLLLWLTCQCQLECKQSSVSHSPKASSVNQLDCVKVTLHWFPLWKNAGCAGLNQKGKEKTIW